MQSRHIWTKIEKYIKEDRTIVITGARRVGKTTTIKWILKQINSKNSYYFDLENVANRDLFELTNYDSLINEFQSLGLDITNKLYIAIDEIQYVKRLPSIVKYLQDNYDIKFILSGSSSYYLKNLFSESLSGRKIIFEIFPLTFSEFLDFQGVDYKINTNLEEVVQFNAFAYEKLSSYYSEYINWGGLPQVALANSLEDKRSILEDTFSSYINLDVQSLSDFKSLKDFRKLIKLLAARVGSKTNTSEFASILGISRITVDSYIEFMKKTYLIRSVPVYTNSIDNQVRKQEKLYFIDNGILNINADLSSGSKFENTVSNQLAYRDTIEYYEKNNHEIDFIVDKKYAIEVKETPDKNDQKNLRQRSEDLNLSNSVLVGLNKNASFDGYLWGGLLG